MPLKPEKKLGVTFEPLSGLLPSLDCAKEMLQTICDELIIEDIDLYSMTKEELILESTKLRHTLRSLRDRTGHALCWYNPEIWSVLPEKKQPHPTLPCKPEFLHNCEAFWHEQHKASHEQTPQTSKTT